MKHRSKANGSRNDDWETPRYILEMIRNHIFNNEPYFDPCPLNANFDGLKIPWLKKQND